jgi:uncharacterized protein (TIGR02246 family)
MTEDSVVGESDVATREIARIYRSLHDAWNKRDAPAFAALFAEDGEAIGYDGSEMFGRDEIATTLGQIFARHETATYISKIRDVRLLAPDVAHLRAVAGLVPPGQTDIAAQLNAIQTLITVKRDGEWRIAYFQNTPLQYHGRPELAEQVSEELRQALRTRGEHQ